MLCEGSGHTLVRTSLYRFTFIACLGDPNQGAAPKDDPLSLRASNEDFELPKRIHRTSNTLDLYDLRVGVFEIAQLEKTFSILPSNSSSIAGAHFSIVKPVTSIVEMLKGIIHREQDAMGANFSHTKVERRGREVAGGCQPKVLIEVLPDRFLATQTQLLLTIFKPMVDTPHVKRNVLAQMTKDDL